PPPVRRLPALDVCRGLAIVLVVLHHSVLHLDAAHLLPAAWRAVNGELVLLRMPLFFLVSGLLAASAARRPWGSLVRSRLVPLLWVFLLWSLVRFAVFSAVTPRFQPWETDSVVPLLLAPVRPTTGLWYLYALAAFTALARALGRRAPLVLLPAAVLSVAASEELLRAPFYVWHQMARCWVFFLLGWCLRAQLLRALGALRVLPAAALSAAGAAVLTAHGRGLLEAPGAGSAVSAVAVVCGLASAVLLTSLPGTAALSAALGRLGRSTLPVYLVHELVVGVGVSAAVALGLGARGARPGWLPVAAVALAVALPLALHAAARRAGAGWLYEVPAAVPAVLGAVPVRALGALRSAAPGAASAAGRAAPGQALGSTGAALAFGDGRAGAPGVARRGGVRGARAGRPGGGGRAPVGGRLARRGGARAGLHRPGGPPGPR
ncbi:acyltransferase family protein, partial [Kineococcus indalonis]|uniref:acyltransferase family protein n=1 Tax=Kineococcus indalonis TaxID=2696566 RepID=UPI001F0EC553